MFGKLVLIGVLAGSVLLLGACQPLVDPPDVLPPYPQPVADGVIRRVDDTFWSNMDDFVFRILENGDTQLYLVVLSANWFNREENRALGYELFRKPESYYANVVIPLVQRYGNTGAIWAIDCLDEPESMILGADGNWAAWGLSWPEMQGYLAGCAAAVHSVSSSILVSAGSGWHDWANVQAGRFSGLGLDFLDFHYYADSPALPSAAVVGSGEDVIIGAFGQSSALRDDDVQFTAVDAAFAQAKAGGYLAAFGWFYDFAGSIDQQAHLNSDGSWRKVELAYDTYASDPGVRIGLNLAWLDGAYGHDFASNPIDPDWTVTYDHQSAAAVVADYSSKQISLMRMFTFEGMEGLHFNMIYSDFEADEDGWIAEGSGVTATTTDSVTDEGSRSLSIHIDTATPGWYGVRRDFDADARLNLDPAGYWRYWAHNGSTADLGINLAFTTSYGGDVSYQTRSGPTGGQLWLAGDSGSEKVVSLSSTDFESQWALSSSPTEGAERPDAAAMQKVSSIRLRVYLSAGQLPFNGDIFIDGMRVGTGSF